MRMHCMVSACETLCITEFHLILLAFLKAAHLHCALTLLKQLCFLHKQDLDIQDLFGQILLTLFVPVCIIF